MLSSSTSGIDIGSNLRLSPQGPVWGSGLEDLETEPGVGEEVVVVERPSIGNLRSRSTRVSIMGPGTGERYLLTGYLTFAAL